MGITHGLVGFWTWLIIIYNVQCSFNSNFKLNWKSLLAALLISSIIDSDHFIQAHSLQLKDAVGQTDRPFLHCSAVPVIYLVCSLLIGAVSRKPQFSTQGVLVFSIILSHHIRDASRRGLWIWGIKDDIININIPYPAYLISVLLLPLVLHFCYNFCDSCHTSRPVSKYSPMIQV